jgi:nucleotide-binding universal stress UspA family protein
MSAGRENLGKRGIRREVRMRVLIALDGTPQSMEIVREGISRPWPEGSRFLLLHVLDPFPFAKMPISLQRAKDATTSQLKGAAEEVVKAGWKAEVDVVLGRARHVLPKIAGEWKADLVLVGSNGGGELQRVLLGSTARTVLRQAPCSVEIIRPRLNAGKNGRPPGMKVLVATDGSECSTAAIRSVASRPWPKGSTFKVISIPEPFMPLGEFPYFELKEVEDLNTAAQQDAKGYAEFGASILAKAGLETASATPLPRDNDAREITREAKRWHADVVILGSHGRRGFDRWSIGSVSEHVALDADCSVEVIRGSSLPEKESTEASKKDEHP